MKTLNIFILLITLNFGILYSQTDRCSTQTSESVRTDPNNAINERYPSKTNTNGRILNWVDDEFEVNCNYLHPSLNPIESPFNQLQNPVVNHFLNNKDNKPEDGWELLYRGFGFDDEGVPISGDNNPFIVLYNKFTGILRVFTIVANNNTDYSYANVKLRYRPDGTDIAPSLLDLTLSDSTKPLISLSEFPATGVTYNNYLLNNVVRFENKSHWFYADFAVTYDPCTCLNKSKLWIDVCLISQAEVNITGLLDGVLANITNGKSNNTDSKIDIAEASLSVTQIGKNIVETHKSINKFNTDVSKHIDELYKNDTEKKESTKKSLNIFENLLGDGVFSKVYKAVPIVGDVLTFLDFFAGGGKKSGPQEVKLMPTSIKAKLSLTGSITSTPPFQSIIFWNPGSNFTNSPFDDREYPIYDHILGTFNLLKTPKVNINKVYSTICSEVSGGDWFFDIYDTLNINLSESIQYVLNPVAFSQNPNDIGILAAIEFTIDKISCDNAISIISSNGISHIIDNTYRTEYVPIQCLTDNYFQLIVNSKSTYHNPTPEEILNDYCNSGYSCGGVTIKNVRIKLLNEYTRIDQNIYPNADKIVELRTYKPTVSWSGVNNDDEIGSLSNYPQNLVIENQVIDGDITAWGDIEIGENVTSVSNDIIYITSLGGSIKVKPGVILSPNVILRIGTGNICETSMYAPVQHGDVMNFCQSDFPGNYRPTMRGDLKVRSNYDEIQSRARYENIALALNLFPNPASTELNLRFSVPESTTLKLTISNMLGELLLIPVNSENHPSGEFSIPVDVSVLSPGVYYCTMQCPLGVITKSFVVIK